MTDLLTDVRYALRSFSKNPGFATVALLTMTIGVGANVAIFSVVNGVILRPLPYEAPDRLVSIASQFPTIGFDRFWISAPEFMEYRERNQSFAEMGAYVGGEVSLNGADQPLRVQAGWATAGLFDVLGVPARLGRVFTAEEDAAGVDQVMVITEELWGTAFNSDPGIIGRALLVDGASTTVVGVMPRGFDVEESGAEVWIPAGFDPANLPGRGSHFLYAIGRLKPGVTIESARAELGTLIEQWPETNPGEHTPNSPNHMLVVSDLHDQVVGDIRPALILLLGAVGFVLLIASANVANLLLARAESRQKEIAVRAAMGASRTRLLRQFLTEGATLALAGGVLGVGAAAWGLRALLAGGAADVPRVSQIGLDPTVLVFALAVSLATGLLFGLAPIIHLTARSLGAALTEGGQRSTAGAGRKRLRGSLVVAEIALAIVLVVGSGLMIRSFVELQRVDLGFDPDNVLTFSLELPGVNYPNPEDAVAFYAALVADLRSMPSVTGAAAMAGLPPNRRVNANTTAFEGIEATPDGPPLNVDYYQTVTADYFETMGIPIVEGRSFLASDATGAPPVALVNETMAELFWPGENPIGRRVGPGWGSRPLFTIVGIVRDVKQGGVDQPTGTELYFHHPQVPTENDGPDRAMHVVMRTAGDPASVVNAARAAVARLDPTLPLAGLATMKDVVWSSVARNRFLTLLLGIFAAIALVLAAVGTYGVISCSVAEQYRAIGIRMAIGAQSSDVLRLVIAGGLKSAGLGVALGLAGAFGLTRLMESMIFGVGTRDPVAFVTAPAVMFAVALVASYLPALRATRVDPVEVIRAE